MRRKRSLTYKAAPSKKRAHLGVAFAVLAVILLGAVSFVLILAYNDFDFSKFLGARAGKETASAQDAPSERASASSRTPFTDTEAVNVLFFCAEGGQELNFCELVSFSEKENAIRVKPISLESEFSWNGAAYSLRRLFADFSASAVSAAMQDKNIRVARYVILTESAFKQILQTLGDVDVNVPRDVTYTEDGITYSQKAGAQRMRPEVLLKYMKYAFEGDEKLQAEGEAFACILRRHFTAEIVLRGEEFFSSLIDRASTNFSVFDYADHKDDVLRFLGNAPRVEVIS